MVRRMSSGVVTVAVAVAMAMSLPGTATAAKGTLDVSGNTFTDPGKGCYTGRFVPLSVNNRTDQTVTIYGSSNCTGSGPLYVLGTLAPGKSGIYEFGGSVYVPH